MTASTGRGRHRIPNCSASGSNQPRTLRAGTALRVRFVAVRFVAVRFLAVVLTLTAFAVPVVLFDLRVRAVFAFTAFALAVAGVALVDVFFFPRGAGRLSTFGDV